MALPPGSRIGRYEILERLGAGGMGVVYRARDDVLDRMVAVKLLPHEFLGEPDRLRRFALEARVTGRLNHPHIIAVFDADVDGQQPFLVTELLEGETLRARLSTGVLPLDEALALARQVARALAAAHAQGIIHRDLKPENILITREGSAKVLDFGLAKIASLSPGDGETHLSATAPGVALGTAGYMAPEQVAGRAVDHRADVFALGVVLHECLSGTQAFRRESVIDTLHAVLHDEPSDLPSTVPVAIRQVVRRCLAKAPADRFQTASELELALGAAGAPSAATARGRTRTLRTARARATAVGLGVTLLLALLAAAWTWTRSSGDGDGAAGHATSIRAIAVLPLEDLSKERDQDYLVDSLTEALITDLSQIRALRVIGRTSVMRYRVSKRPLPEIARELGVTGIVEGTVLRVNDRLRVTARLIHAETEQHVWGEQYDRPSSTAGKPSGSIPFRQPNTTFSACVTAKPVSSTPPSAPPGRCWNSSPVMDRLSPSSPRSGSAAASTPKRSRCTCRAQRREERQRPRCPGCRRPMRPGGCGRFVTQNCRVSSRRGMAGTSARI